MSAKITARTVICRHCTWCSYEVKKGLNQGRRHAEITGHLVMAETTQVRHYYGKKRVL
jgi:hypothetical protein